MYSTKTFKGPLSASPIFDAIEIITLTLHHHHNHHHNNDNNNNNNNNNNNSNNNNITLFKYRIYLAL